MAPDEPPAQHHEVLCDSLDSVLGGDIKNLMVFMPPGSAKSTYASVRFPAYFLGRLEKKSIICASYGDDLATSFGRKVRNLVSSREYKMAFPGIGLAQDSQAKGEWETQQGGGYFAVGVGGGVTGRRADLGLIDDPVKGRKEADSDTVKESTWQWYNSDFLTRLKPGAAQIIIQTRWVEDDLSGRILPESWNGESGIFDGRDGKTWHVICLQAQAEEGKNDPLNRKPGEWLWTDWFTPEWWQETKKTQQQGDVRNWSALYQQTPVPDDGEFFKKSWWIWYDNPPENRNIIITHDDGVTDDGDPTEIFVWAIDEQDDIKAIDHWGGQTTSDIWVDVLIDFMDQYNAFACVGEGGPIRRSVEPFLIKRMNQRRIYSMLKWLPTIGDKPSRAQAFRALMSMGKVSWPRTEWAAATQRELIRFPAGALDNKVDACGLLGRAINQTWAPKAIVKKEKPDPFKPPTLNEVLKQEASRKVRRKRL